MSIDIKELYKSDLDPASPSLWWSSKKVEKLNWNFDQIKLSNGGPYGPQGFEGKLGFEGITGPQGNFGFRGFQGVQGVFGPKGYGDWAANTKAGQNNITIKYIETKTDPSNTRIGYANTDTEYVLDDTSGTTVKRYNTKDPLQNNLMFVTSNIDPGNNNLPTRKAVFFNLHTGNDNNGNIINTVLDSGFQNEIHSIWKFRLSPGTGRKFSFLTAKSSSTEMLELSPLKFEPKSSVSNFNAGGTFNNTVQIKSNYYGTAGVDKIAATDYDMSGTLGVVMWKDINVVLPTFPIGSIIAVDKEFTDTYFSLNKTGILLDLAAVAGYASTVPVIQFTFGAGLSNGKFKGWYLCNGKTWQKGAVSYTLPNLCGFDLNVDYPVYADSLLTPPPVGVGNINITTTNREVLGSAQVSFKAWQPAAAGYYSYSNGTSGQDAVRSSYIDNGEPDTLIYTGSTTSNQLETSTGKGDGLFYLCFLGEDGFTWSSAGSPITINTISLAFGGTSSGYACVTSSIGFGCNFATGTWTESSTWTTNDNKLYVSGSSAYASSGWYASGGVARYWDNATAKFTSRVACVTYLSTQLVYNSAAINAGINGAFSGLSKSTYYIDGSSLSNSTFISNNSSGTSYASAGWYRDSGSRRYWDGNDFLGAIFTLDYVNIIDAYSPLGYATTAVGACNGTYNIYGYYQSSIATSQSFSSIANLFVGGSSAGSGEINYANSAYYFSDGSISRKCNNSSTGALNSAVSCFTSSPGSGGGGCVLFGTKISMNDGTFKNVQDVSVGDALYSKTIVGLPMLENTKDLFDWKSDKLDIYDEDVTVVGIQTFNVNVVLSFNDGKLFTTKDHLHLYKSNGLWRIGYAIDVKAGDMLLTENGVELEVNSIVETKGHYIVYKVDVEENDMFFANGILTHNKPQAIE